MIYKPLIPPDPDLESSPPPPPPFAAVAAQPSTATTIEAPTPHACPRFPSRSLISMSMVSCFLATAAFISSLAAFSTRTAYATAHNAAGALLTVSFHVYMYRSAQKHKELGSAGHDDNHEHDANANTNADVSPVFVKNRDVVFMYLQVSLWVMIFYVDIASSSARHAGSGMIMAAVWAGLEWAKLLFIALKCTREVYLVESRTPDPLIEHEGTGEGEIAEPRYTSAPRPMLLISFILCTITAMIFSSRPSPLSLLNLLAYLTTAPHHIALFVASLRSRKCQEGSLLARRPSSLPYASSLAALWCCVFVLDVVGPVSARLFQKIVSGIFAGAECGVVVFLAVRCVLESFNEGRIRL
ncbi:hypothetical protein D9615_002090 [Tricholomella constricta]|uniref:Uncharacterized protein n=1 Tax=Tricholomella constricta TaxID=117010 RepID=A0A8H5MAS9_9AGAR|nr:hypothetical protein D9615_002090 [Tricholomella constricta]